MVGIGTTGGFSIVLASNPWLVARVLAYLRIATVAARIAAAVHACMVWLVCVTILVGKNGVKWLWCRLLRDHGRDWYNRRV